MPSWVLISWTFLLVVYVAEISCSPVDFNLTSDFLDEARDGILLNDVREKTVKRRQAPGDWCVIPPPMQNGKYRPSANRCPPGDTTPACKMLEGAFVFPNWVIYLDSCDPGYVINSKNTVSVCANGRWTPRLPTCAVCPRSDTLVNGKTVCRGEVIFEDTFSGPLSDKWRHWIFYGGKAWKYNEFISDKKNSFTSNGKLVIRPTLHHDAYVTSGTHKLDGCTGNRTSDLCVRTATPDTILPPVSTANLITNPKFGFTYGEVEIRAKLPKGDWLVPWLWLESSKDYYGGNDASGRIELAVTLGNSDLQCDGENFGLGRMEFRVTLGPQNNLVYKKFLLKDLSKKWLDDYHNYTLIWKPGSIAFKTDDKWIGEISVTNKKICEESYFGLTEEECKIYSNGSMLAPFDKEFFIGITLTAGDLRYITDGCINRGKVKAWKYNETQEVLKFWQDRGHWLSTWTEDGSSLYIDHVRVTAV